MRRAFSSRPSPAMVVALLALFVALGGTGYAAIKVNGKNIKSRTIAGKKLKKNTLTGTEINESKLGIVPNAKTAKNANSANDATQLGGRDADSFLSADGTATDSNALGGLPPSSYVRRECDQTTGQIKGFVSVNASAIFSGTFTAVSGYNCSGQSIEARRLSMGRYEVRFNGSPVTLAVATANVTDFSADAVSVTNTGPGAFTIYVLNPVPSPGAFEDDAFNVITP